jgi:membrane protein implicated in regulation of membrane protease activity
MTCTFWMFAALALFAIEILTPGVFFFACLGVGALGACLAHTIFASTTIDWISFAAVSVGSIYALRPVAKKYLTKGIKKSNVDTLLGQRAWVTEAIAPTALGTVKIEGEIWRAEAQEAIPSQTWVLVQRVEGTRLIVKKIQEEK